MLIVIATTSAQIVVARYAKGLDESYLGTKMMKEVRGVCFLFSETGTEGGWWAMQEDGFVSEDGHWKYEGLQYLRDGDDFTVYADDGRVLFHGIIHQDTRTGASRLSTDEYRAHR